MRTEDPDPPGKGKDRGALSEMQHDIYKEKLSAERILRDRFRVKQRVKGRKCQIHIVFWA